MHIYLPLPGARMRAAAWLRAIACVCNFLSEFNAILARAPFAQRVWVSESDRAKEWCTSAENHRAVTSHWILYTNAHTHTYTALSLHAVDGVWWRNVGQCASCSSSSSATAIQHTHTPRLQHQAARAIRAIASVGRRWARPRVCGCVRASSELAPLHHHHHHNQTHTYTRTPQRQRRGLELDYNRFLILFSMG